ncbi:hypothetical protein POX_e06612 [Penicillium oxalicum]|nr:hypothetical protein POX_e06612 [Penicillium oxalicum]KAI2788592.1 hypothetical protein POX_e06612 [Penicillium oxalicum]
MSAGSRLGAISFSATHNYRVRPIVAKSSYQGSPGEQRIPRHKYRLSRIF